MSPEQGYLPTDGMEPPRNKDIERAIDGWLEARREQRRAADTTKKRHDALMLRMTDAGIERYPFVDPDTKKKCVMVASKEPKAKVVRGNRAKFDREPRKPKKSRRKPKPSDEDQVESRRVPRTKEHDKAADPFGSVRSKLKKSNGDS